MVRIWEATMRAIPGEALFTIRFTGNIELDDQTTETLRSLGVHHGNPAKVFQPNQTTVVIQVDYDHTIAGHLYDIFKSVLSIDGIGRPSGRTIDISDAPALQRV